MLYEIWKNTVFHLVVSVVIYGSFANTAAPQFPEIDFEDLRTMLENPNLNHFYLIDVRRPEELIKDGEIVNTTLNIPLPQLESILMLPGKSFRSVFGIPKPKPTTLIIFTCRTGRRAFIAAEKARRLGFYNLKVYRGSITEWKAKEGPLVQQNGHHPANNS